MIRPATPQDRNAIAALHTESWRDAYRCFLPDAFLDGDLAERHRREWTELSPLTFVADRDGLVGFAAGWAEPGGLYLDNLHVVRAARGQGIARRLMGAMAAACPPDGRLRLTVIEGNERARAAYTALGGREGAPFDDDVHGHPVRSVEVRWAGDALARLRATGRTRHGPA